MCRKAPVEQQGSGVSKETSPKKLKQGDEWLENFDFQAFRSEIQVLGKKLEAEQGPADVKHLNKMVMWSNVCAAIGLLTMGFGINPISIIGISTFTFSRWTMIDRKSVV